MSNGGLIDVMHLPSSEVHVGAAGSICGCHFPILATSFIVSTSWSSASLLVTCFQCSWFFLYHMCICPIANLSGIEPLCDIARNILNQISSCRLLRWMGYFGGWSCKPQMGLGNWCLVYIGFWKRLSKTALGVVIPWDHSSCTYICI